MTPQQAELFGAQAPSLPEGFVFQPGFLSTDEERALLEAIGRPPIGTYKDLYRVGELVTVDVAPLLASVART